MRKLRTRIFVCLVPVLLSALVVGWAVREYLNGRGGFRLGVDLVGGTILVYEVDESKMQAGQQFKAEDLAAALKRRIDPADLYNITIRPVAGNPPRVEIILPTGGVRQAEAEARNWRQVLDEVAQKWPVKGKEDFYDDVPTGERIELIDRVQKYHPKVSGDDVDAVVHKYMGGGGKERRQLTSEEINNIKSLIERQGRLEFRILANRTDDGPAIAAAEAWFKNKANWPELERRERRAEAPPPPRDPNSDSLFFPVKLASGGEEQHSYSWVEIGKSELYSLSLNSEALKKDKFTSDMVERALKSHETFSPPRLPSSLFHVRRISDWSRRLDKDRKLGKAVEFFILVRDPNKGQEVTGDFLVRASEGQNIQSGGDRAIEFQFNSEGGNRFYDVTSKNRPTGDRKTGFHRHLAILFDSQVYSAPQLNEPIRTNGQITGRFTQQEVQDMVRILRAGALPATLKKDPVSQNSMSPTLGEDTINKGVVSVLAAFVAVMVFMIIYYRFAGLVACVALFANLLLTIAFMVLVQAAFTLPGLAGLVLMLGMAVDANVLIYERLREERERGASLSLALRNGYDRAFPTIIDTHLSSIFTAIVLYIVGNDQLKGFGISLTVGLIISLFTSLYMTRTMFELWLAKGWMKDMRFAEWFHWLLSRFTSWPNIDFMGIRYYWFTATIVLTILGAGLFVYRLDKGGLNIDFVGGTAYTAQLVDPLSVTQLREKLEPGSDAVLPALAIEQIYVAGRQAEGDKSDYFTVRTANQNVQQVMDFVNERMGANLKRVYLTKYDIVGGNEAVLYFGNEEGKKDFASPAQVQRVLTTVLADNDLSRVTFSLDRESRYRAKGEDHYSQLKLRLSEPIGKDTLKKVLAQTKDQFARAPQPERLENFDAGAGRQTQERALYAILASWMAILLYLWFRFGSWTFGAATVLCLIHDLFFTLGAIACSHFVYQWAGGPFLGIHDFKIDLNTVAALLTLVGYSVNDTIVVFDRIREVRGKNPALTPKMINDSVNQTFTRTILTAMTVWIVVLVLYIWGGEGVKLFSFVMVVGVIVGTYSSIYIASPLLLIFGEGAAHAERIRATQPAAARE
jgi:SecD/SecF fusion protein